uniref:Uncharacterized protein n=1 Tax=Ursus americanus TaxID=9643 RepID=A0A452RNI1_URSAM
MTIPTCCFTCGKIAGNKREAYPGCCRTYTEGAALDALGRKYYCRGGMLLAHADLIEFLNMYAPKNKASKYMKQKLLDLLGEINCPTDYKDFSTIVSGQVEKSEKM